MAFIRQIKNMAKNKANLQKYGKCHKNKVLWQPWFQFELFFKEKTKLNDSLKEKIQIIEIFLIIKKNKRIDNRLF